MVLSGVPRKKFPVTPPGIDPGTFRLVAQCHNIIILYYITILWDHRRICGPSLTENIVKRRMIVVLPFGSVKLGHVWLRWKMWNEGNVRVDLKAGQHRRLCDVKSNGMPRNQSIALF